MERVKCAVSGGVVFSLLAAEDEQFCGAMLLKFKKKYCKAGIE
jgi:hypothetical protein